MNLDFSGMPAWMGVWMGGLKITLLVTLFALVLSVLIAFPVALCRMSRFRVLRAAATFYVSVFRGVPMIVQVLFIYVGLPPVTGMKLTPFLAGGIALGLNSSAFLSELLRGGIQAVDHGQREAAMALGISNLRTTFGIVVPQAIKSILPGIINEVIGVLKGSSLVYSIGLAELLKCTQTVISATYRAFEPYLIVSAFYYVMVMALDVLARRLERWVNRSDQHS